ADAFFKILPNRGIAPWQVWSKAHDSAGRINKTSHSQANARNVVARAQLRYQLFDAFFQVSCIISRWHGAGSKNLTGVIDSTGAYLGAPDIKTNRKLLGSNIHG